MKGGCVHGTSTSGERSCVGQALGAQSTAPSCEGGRSRVSGRSVAWQTTGPEACDPRGKKHLPRASHRLAHMSPCWPERPRRKLFGNNRRYREKGLKPINQAVTSAHHGSPSNHLADGACFSATALPTHRNAFATEGLRNVIRKPLASNNIILSPHLMFSTRGQTPRANGTSPRM